MSGRSAASMSSGSASRPECAARSVAVSHTSRHAHGSGPAGDARPQDRDADRPGRACRSSAGILALVADGLTNAEIAARLVLSVREDDHHASAVLTKLGMTPAAKAVDTARHR